MRRRHQFTAPFVLTVALSPACKKEEPAPPPRTAADAAPARAVDAAPASPDATPAPAVPDAAPAAPPDAGGIARDAGAATKKPRKTDALVWNSGGSCYEYAPAKERRLVSIPCPPEGATVAFAEQMVDAKEGDRTFKARFNPWSRSCEEHYEVHCPPPDVATCNPPMPRPITCPPELLPTLIGVAPTKQAKGECWWEDLQVACPEK
jgi:hypothetical protein